MFAATLAEIKPVSVNQLKQLGLNWNASLR
jgi:hypothetical protein